MPNPTVLVVEDEPDIRLLVGTLLERAGYDVVEAVDGQDALRKTFERRPDLIVLDITMPKLDGWQVLERMRELSDHVPIFMLTAAGDELDKVRALRAGADDFVTKPFGRQELIARVEALLRRSRPVREDAGGGDVSVVGPLRVDHEQRIAMVDDEELRLTPLEFRMLAAFARNPRQVLAGDQLAELVWNDAFVAADQVKLVVARLQRKLEPHFRHDPIETVRGFGYRFRAAED